MLTNSKSSVSLWCGFHPSQFTLTLYIHIILIYHMMSLHITIMHYIIKLPAMTKRVELSQARKTCWAVAGAVSVENLNVIASDLQSPYSDHCTLRFMPRAGHVQSYNCTFVLKLYFLQHTQTIAHSNQCCRKACTICNITQCTYVVH